MKDEDKTNVILFVTTAIIVGAFVWLSGLDVTKAMSNVDKLDRIWYLEASAIPVIVLGCLLAYISRRAAKVAPTFIEDIVSALTIILAYFGSMVIYNYFDHLEHLTYP
jgi:cytochrome bd-type quinol oxidase subunit 2